MELNLSEQTVECSDRFYIYTSVSDIRFDLQRFSAESEGRTEKPSEHKKRKAREEGRAPLSKDLPGSLITVVCFAVIYALGKYFFEIMYNNMQFILSNSSTINILESASFGELLIKPCLQIFLPIAAVAFIVGILSNYGQIGFKFTPKAIKPDFKKISPNIFKFFKNQVFSPTGFFNLAKSLVKVGIIGVVSYLTIHGNLDKLLALIEEHNVMLAFIQVCKIAFGLIIKASIIMALFSIVDVFFTRKQYEEQLKMKKEEVKSRINQMYQELLSREKQLKAVPEADVVITNPTHFAVALRYNNKIENAPRVIAKGQDNFAQQIKKVARDNGIFLYENVPLARRLYKEVKVGEEIPPEVFGFVLTAYRLAAEYNLSRHQETVDA